MRQSGARLTSRFIAPVIAVAVCATPVVAQSARHRFDIPAGPATTALQTFARQSGRQLLFPFDQASAQTVRAVRGVLDDRQLLARLARLAGLRVVSDDGRTVVLGRAVPSRPAVRIADGGKGRSPAIAGPPVRPSAPVAAALSASDVVVTATKRPEVLVDIPLAVSVVPGADLGRRGLHAVADLQDVLPDLTVNGVQHGLTIAIRGVTTTDITSKGEQGIAFNVDGVFIGRPIEQAEAFFDLDRIEVLRGPQGTLYGRSSTGGAVNLVTAKPVDRWEGHAQLDVGNFGTVRSQGAINVPLAPWLAVRVAAAANRHAGFLQPSDGSPARSSQDDRTVRVTALARFAPTVTARATVTAGSIGGTGAGYANLGNFLDAHGGATRRSVHPDPFPARLDHHFLNVDGELNVDLGGARLTYLGSRQRFDADEQSSNTNDPNDPDLIGVPTIYAAQLHGRYRARIVSDVHELRIASVAPARIDYVAGANYYHETIYENDHVLAAPLGDPDPANSFNYNDIIGRTDHRSYSLFGQATLHLAPRLALVSGLRYSWDGVDRQGTSAFGLYDAAGNPCYGTADCLGNPASGHESAAKLTYRIGIDLRPAADTLVYGSIATGYKAGGFNDASSSSATPTGYAPEQLTAYELGYKGRPTGTLRLGASLYYYDYARTQLSGVIFLAGSGVLNTRVVPTRLYGAEAEATWSLARRTSLELSVATERSCYVRFLAGYRQDIDWSGLSLDRTPAFIVTGALDQAWDIGDGWALRARASTKISSSYYTSDFTSGLRYRQPAFTRSDASLTLAAPGDAWTVQAYVRNVEDGLQAVSAPQNYDPGFLNAGYLYVSDPRTWGLRVAARF